MYNMHIGDPTHIKVGGPLYGSDPPFCFTKLEDLAFIFELSMYVFHMLYGYAYLYTKINYNFLKLSKNNINFTCTICI